LYNFFASSLKVARVTTTVTTTGGVGAVIIGVGVAIALATTGVGIQGGRTTARLTVDITPAKVRALAQAKSVPLAAPCKGVRATGVVATSINMLYTFFVLFWF
jgi:hypothetical protein